MQDAEEELNESYTGNGTEMYLPGRNKTSNNISIFPFSDLYFLFRFF